MQERRRAETEIRLVENQKKLIQINQKFADFENLIKKISNFTSRNFMFFIF